MEHVFSGFRAWVIVLWALAAAQLSFASSPLRWAWVGGVEADRAVLTAVIDSEDPPSLRVTAHEGGEPLRFGPEGSVPAAGGGRLWRFSLAGLRADTRYAYVFEDAAGRALDEEPRSFSSMPAAGAPASFRFALGSCARGIDSPVFTAAERQGARFFLHVGDFHYADIAENKVEIFRLAYDLHLRAPRMRAMLASMPLLYQWDDHDYGPNDSNRRSPSREASLRNFRELVPHYPLPVRDAESEAVGGPTDQAFTVGRARFILSDLRSRRDPKTRRMMGPAQDAWLREQLLEAKGRYPLIFWVSSVPWNGAPGDQDRWQGYAEHRAEIAAFIRDNGITGLCILAGDAHMTAIDDGTHADFAPGGGSPRIRIFQAGPIFNRGSYKGGPYSHGAQADTPASDRLQQFGLVEVKDEGGPITVTFSGREGADGVGERVLQARRWGEGPIELSFTVGEP